MKKALNSAVAGGAATVAAEKSGFEFDYSLHFLFQRKKLEKKNPFLICFGFLEIKIGYPSVKIKNPKFEEM